MPRGAAPHVSSLLPSYSRSKALQACNHGDMEAGLRLPACLPAGVVIKEEEADGECYQNEVFFTFKPHVNGVVSCRW